MESLCPGPGRSILGPFPDGDLGDFRPAQGARGFEAFGEMEGEVFRGRVPSAEGRMLVDVGVVELLRDRFERLLRRDEIHGDVVALELLGFAPRFRYKPSG